MLKPMMAIFKILNRLCFLFLLFYGPTIVSGQDNASLTCSDVRNGIFNYFDQRSGESESFIRKGGIQREILPKRRETIIWEVNWLNECTYNLKYQSGGENRTREEQKILKNHIIVVEILRVSDDYL